MRHPSISRSLLAAAVTLSGLASAACASDAASTDSTQTTESNPAPAPEPTTAPDELQRFPDVVDAEASLSSTGWRFSVTISSPYDSPDRYADGWRILGADGTEYGFRLLTHDHAAEQPFTRTLDGVEIPADVTMVIIEARDQEYGFGGTTFELTLPTN